MQYKEGNYAKAEPVLRQAIEVLPTNRVELIWCLKSLGEICRSRGNFTESIMLNLRCLDVMAGGMEKTDPRLLAQVDFIADLYNKTGRFEEVERLYRKMGLVDIDQPPPPTPPPAPAPPPAVQMPQPQPQPQPQEPTQAASEGAPLDAQVLEAFQQAKKAAEVRAATESLEDLMAQVRSGTFKTVDRQDIPPLEPAQPADQVDLTLKPPDDADEPVQLSNYERKPISSPRRPGSSAKGLRHNESQGAAGVDAAEIMQKLIQLGAQFFGPQEIGDVQRLESEIPAEERARGLIVTIALFAVLIGGFVMAFNLLPRKNPEVAFAEIPHSFRTSDGKLTITFTNYNAVEAVQGDQKVQAAAQLYLNDWRDAVTMSSSELMQRQYIVQLTPDGLKDFQGRIFYDASASVPKITTAMETLSNSAVSYYNAAKKYPDTLDEMGGGTLGFNNPFTQKYETPVFQRLTLGDEKSAEEADKARAAFYAGIATGQLWNKEDPLTPGCVHCCTVTFITPRGQINAFFVKGADGNGKQIAGAQKGTTFYRAFEDGKEQTGEPATMPFGNTEMLTRPWTVWLLPQDASANLMYWLKNGAAIFWAVGIFIWCIRLFGAKPKGEEKMLVMFCMTVCLIMTVVYALHDHLP